MARKRAARKPRVPDWAKILAPPKARGRKREARRWLDVLAARCINGRWCDRLPGERWIPFREGAELHRTGLVDLEIRDPSLYRAAREVMFEDSFEYLDISYKEWQKRAIKRADRLSALRRQLLLAESM